ncbi:MAG: ATP-dependent DNA helicase RecG, partial [Candidatus Margulisiibacteriota bacterium]
MSNKDLETSVQYIKGVGPKLAKVFEKVGVRTVEDILYFIPRSYEDRRNVKPIVQIRPSPLEVIKGKVTRVEMAQTRSRYTILKVILHDGTASIQAIWFNQPFLQRLFRPGMGLIVSGKVEYSSFDHQLQVMVRGYEIDTGENQAIVPVYPLTEGLYPKKVKAIVDTAVEKYLGFVENEKIRKAIQTLHAPKDINETIPAREYLAYEELYMFQLGLLLNHRKMKDESTAVQIDFDPNKMEQFTSGLPFSLTAAQKRVLIEIFYDLKSGKPMNRLLQGDVGSGKTIVAALAAYAAILSGYQVAILAPTEILAQQHYEKMKKFFKGQKIKIDMITSATSIKTKSARVLDDDLIIGTHAILEEKIKFNNLGLVIIDEQHRFGVEQRMKIIEKGNTPHVMIMTATPIPRSLALSLFGDLDRSVIDELPPGRKAIKTYFVPEEKRQASYKFISDKIRQGRQVFVVCPLVEESFEVDFKSVIEEAARLQTEVFPKFKVGLIHGKMKSAEKEEVMNKFIARKIHILVSTTVIEVGIDIPNATIMMVEHAERFGLSQLHQLRGRIGRGSEESFCFLVGNPKTEGAEDRMRVMISTNDGFKIAEEDLRLRGPGDFYGVRQSGLPIFRVADIIRDEKLMQKARTDAAACIDKDINFARNCWDSQRKKVEGPQKE